MAVVHHLDPEAKPPAAIKDVYKTFQKLKRPEIDTHLDILHPTQVNGKVALASNASGAVQLPSSLRQVFHHFVRSAASKPPSIPHVDSPAVGDVTCFESSRIPGLIIYPSLLPPEVQLNLLDRLLHRDLCDPEHQTNVHLHHDVKYPNDPDMSLFDASLQDVVFLPKDPAVHKSIIVQQVLDKKLRWMTLGGQYDWTNKVYPAEQPPPFPADVKKLVEDLFPMKAEAAIVNLYSPGDTLSLHRDLSEECNQPLGSISMGCDGIFVVGLDGEDENGQARVEAIRLKSGDAVLMSGPSRYAWHGVPKVLEGTCPEWMQDWPFHHAINKDDETYERYKLWKGWMKGKRINLNVRQMFDHSTEQPSQP